ncbi:MAG TPA: helix-turn-helix domain-containing protein [Limnochordia bacterium]
MEALLTPAQVAKRLQVAERTVYEWLRTGKLPGIRMGRLWRIEEQALAAFLHGGARTDEEPLSAEEIAECDAGWREYLAGEGRPWEEVRAELSRG